MPRKTKANAFSDELCEWLNDRTRFGENVQWTPNHRLDRRGRDFVDVVGVLKPKKWPSILIEVELHREDPVSNVVKIFKWAQDNQKRHLVLFHAFSGLYRIKKAERKERALWLGGKFEKECASTYIPLNLKYSPRQGGRFGGGRRTKAAKLLARQVMEHILKLKLVAHR
ncbi:MAG: hypothetical protein WCE53_15855 [Candidatus Acidiferrum sp.]